MSDIFRDSISGYKIVKVVDPLQEFLRRHLVALIGEPDSQNDEIENSDSFRQLVKSIKEEEYNNLAGLSRDERTISKQIVTANEEILKDWIGLSTTKPSILVNNDIYYRIIDAQISSTISRVHRDIYFHNILEEWNPYSDITTVKMWIPLYLESAAVLGVVPGSHLDINHEDCRYSYDNGSPSEFSCSITPSELTPIPVDIGEALLFPSSLLHGSLNKKMLGSRRISAEITLGYQ